MKNSYTKELLVAKSLARKAGKIMRKYFAASDQHKEVKKDGSLVTIADKEINRLVIKEISEKLGDNVIGEEESSARYGAQRSWFCDPVDGTKAFVWGTPTAMFSLALVIKGVPVLGVAYDPFLNLLYEGVKDQGSYCNGKRLQVSSKKLSGEHVAVTSSIKKILNHPQALRRLVKEKVRLVTFSGAVYKACLVARGKFVGYFEVDVSAHDMAAVHVIVEEAGGKVTGYEGKRLNYLKPFKSAIVSNGVVHNKLVKIIN